MLMSNGRGNAVSLHGKEDIFRAVRRMILAPGRRMLGTITNIRTIHALVALTFDDGPSPEYLPRLLAVLKRHGASATFFMIGEKAKRHPQLVEQVRHAGHAIGNHTWSHQSLPGLSWRARLSEIRKGGSATQPHGSRLFRPPYGHQSLMSRIDAWLCGYEVIGWNVDVWDWLKKEPSAMADELENKVKAGDIVLLHDAIESAARDNLAVDRSAMIAALDEFLGRVSGRLEFVTIPELLALGSPVRVNWTRIRRDKGMSE